MLILLVIGCVYAFVLNAQQNDFKFSEKNTWFETILAIKKSEKPGERPALEKKNHPDPYRVALWNFLRKNFNSEKDMLEMSWEERDNIWNFEDKGFSYQQLGRNYLAAFQTSCKERGVPADYRQHTFNNPEDIQKIRRQYITSRNKEYVILTPPVSDTPRINIPLLLGVRPNHPVLFKVPVTGRKPVGIKLLQVPKGCHYDEASGSLVGVVAQKGDYKFTIIAENALGKDSVTVILRVGDTISLTPPMGWSSWSCFGSDVTEKDIRQAADFIVKTGLINYGWSYINIDDCWMNRPSLNDPVFSIKDSLTTKFEAKEDLRKRLSRMRFNESELIGKVRDSAGNILSNKDFPDMKRLTDYIHSIGLKAGIYTSPGHVTCQNYIGSYGHELQDAIQFAKWGFDYLKYDWCGYSLLAADRSVANLKTPYQLMNNALKQVQRDIVYSICEYGWGDVWKWGAQVGGNLWRTTSDIRDTWASISEIGFSMHGKEAYAGPGRWNDPDQLVVGYVGWSKSPRPTYLSPNEQYTQMSLWALLSAPLFIGADLTRLDSFTVKLLSNAEVIAINQDTLGYQGSRMLAKEPVQVWKKKLSDGSFAIGIFNTGDDPVLYDLYFKEIGLQGNWSVRDVWRQKDIKTSGSLLKQRINRHGVLLLKLTPGQKII
ncbi:MAG: glycoside hydrolase family 27 protein [Niabella sp.]